jgi:hypothetical protein
MSRNDIVLSSVLNPHHVDVDPDWTYHHDADPDPDADPDSDFYFIRIRIRLFTLMKIQIRIQGTKMMRIHADPDPQNWFSTRICKPFMEPRNRFQAWRAGRPYL